MKKLIIFLIVGFFLVLFFQEKELFPDGRTTILFRGEVFTITSLSPREKSLSFLFIPAKTLVETAGGYGRYRIEAFNRLEKIENKPFLLQKSLVSDFGLPIDGEINGALRPRDELFKKDLKKWYQAEIWNSLRKIRKTNLETASLLRLYFFSFLVKPEEIKVISLEEGRTLREVSFSDGDVFYELNEEKTDVLIREIFFEKKIIEEGLVVGVANATEKTGLAKEFSRIIVNLGGTVVKLGGWSEQLPSSEIRFNQEENGESFLVQRLAEILNCQIVEKDFDQFPVDILVIIGKDYQQD